MLKVYSLLCSLELNRPENKGLEKAISFLGDIKKSIDEGAVTLGGDITWADLIQIAGICPNLQSLDNLLYRDYFSESFEKLESPPYSLIYSLERFVTAPWHSWPKVGQ